MPAGLQVWNDSDYLQIDGSTSHVVFLRKGSISTTALGNGIVGQYSYCEIALNRGELLAVNGAPCLIAGHYAGMTQLHVQGGAGTVLNYWVFGPYTPSGLNYGLQVFNDDGALIYDSGRRPLRMVTTVSGVGTFGPYGPGKRLALIPRSLHLKFTVTDYAIIQNLVHLILHWTAGFGVVGSDGYVRVNDAQYATDIYQNLNPNTLPSWWTTGGYENGSQNSYAVVDVTGY